MIPLSTIVLSTLFFSLAAVDVVLASIRVNRTIDDQRGDNVTGYVPLYFPNEDWNIGQTCTICAICSGDPIDPTQVFDGTWHDTTYLPGNDAERIILISFTGHAVYVFNMVVNIIIPGGVVTTTDLAFYIDNDYMASFSHSPPSNNSQPSVFYNKLVYSNDSLEQGEHTLQIRSSGNTKALTLFDYVVYSTFEDEAQPSPSSQLISELRFPTQSCDSVSVSSLPAFLCTTPLLGPQVPRKRSHNIGSIVASVMGVVAFVLVYTFILRYCYLRSCQPRCTLESNSLLDRITLPSESGLLRSAHATYLSPLLRDFASCDAIGHVRSPLAESLLVEPSCSGASVAHTEREVLQARYTQKVQAQINELRYMRNRNRAGDDAAHSPAMEKNLAVPPATLRVEKRSLAVVHGEQPYTVGRPRPYHR